MSIIPYRKHRNASPVLSSGFDEIDRLFNNMFNNALTNLSGTSPASVTDWALRMNISETDKSYQVEAELPGLDESDVEITLDDGLLTISGEKKQENEEEGKTFHRIERSYGSFKRSLSLPADANEDDIKARMRNGVLEVTIGKAENAKAKAKKIKVQSQ